MALNLALFSQSAQTISSTEYSLTNNSTTIATQTTPAIISIWLDVNNLAAGDEYALVLRETAVSGGTQRAMTIASLIGVQGDPLFVTAGYQIGVGWDVTLKKIAGTDRAFSWSIRSIN
jgi:hypothetical protein